MEEDNEMKFSLRMKLQNDYFFSLKTAIHHVSQIYCFKCTNSIYIYSTWYDIYTLTSFLVYNFSLKVQKIFKILHVPFLNLYFIVEAYIGPFYSCQTIGVRAMVYNATFNNISVISWWSVLLVEETEVPRENHWPAASHWQFLSHNVVSRTPHHKRDSNSQR